LPEDQNLEGEVNGFLAQLGDVPMPETRLLILVGGETPLKLEVVPGMLGSCDVFFMHNNMLFQLIFLPALSLMSETNNDVEDLYQTVLTSFLFIHLRRKVVAERPGNSIRMRTAFTKAWMDSATSAVPASRATSG
jgi:hypothetical protein